MSEKFQVDAEEKLIQVLNKSIKILNKLKEIEENEELKPDEKFEEFLLLIKTEGESNEV